MILIDSDILIWVLRNNDEYKKKFITATDVSKGKLFITPIQHLEIMSGIREKELINTELFLDSMQTVIINKEIGKLASQFIYQFKKSHGTLYMDALIAACAKYYDFFLWTNNKKHFPMLNKKEFYYVE